LSFALSSQRLGEQSANWDYSNRDWTIDFIDGHVSFFLSFFLSTSSSVDSDLGIVRDFSTNQLSGSIPTEIGSLSLVTTL